jgi:hypothetical protein
MDLDAISNVPPEESTGHHESRTSTNHTSHASENRLGKYVLEYPGPAGQAKYQRKTTFERAFEDNQRHGNGPWAPFTDNAEWGLVEWMLNNLGQGQTDEFLQLDFVSVHMLLNTGAYHYCDRG